MPPIETHMPKATSTWPSIVRLLSALTPNAPANRDNQRWRTMVRANISETINRRSTAVAVCEWSRRA